MSFLLTADKNLNLLGLQRGSNLVCETHYDPSMSRMGKVHLDMSPQAMSFLHLSWSMVKWRPRQAQPVCLSRRSWSQWIMADLVLNRLRLKGLRRRKKHRKHQSAVFSSLYTPVASWKSTVREGWPHLWHWSKVGHSPSGLCSRRRWAPNQFLRGWRGGWGGGRGGLWREENGAVRGLGQV